MLAFIAILFILAITVIIGWRVGRSVPDEVELGGQYLLLGLDVLLILMLSVLLYGFGMLYAALAVVLLIFARRWLQYVFGPLSGVMIGFAAMLDAQLQIILFVLALVFNFLVGVTTEKTKLLTHRMIWQPITALVVFLALSFF